MDSRDSIGSQVGILIAATSCVQLANGYFGTFFALRVALADFGPGLGGLVLSSYFAGFTVGAIFCGRLIVRFGHIRAYAAFAGMVVAATAMLPLLVGALPWIVMRAIIGVGCAGIFVTTESWLNSKAPPNERGRVFSIYMVGSFLALGLGQILVGRIGLETAAPFNVVIGLFAVALVLVSTTRAEAPRITADAPLPYGLLSRSAPVAVVGAVLSGFVSGIFYSLIPAWMQQKGIEAGSIGIFMLAAVLGGLAFQIPVGRLSDRFDRRIVLAGLGAGLAATSVILIHLPRDWSTILPVAALFGGLMSTFYPVCVAHAHDRMPADRVVAVSGRLILLFGVGSVVGPLIGSGLIDVFDVDGVLYLVAAAAALLAVVAVSRSLVKAPPPHLERSFEILAPQAAPLAHDSLGSADK
jgi:MFS family permease